MITQDYLIKSELRAGTLLFRAINHDFRLDLLDVIHDHGELHVNDIADKVEKEQSLVSQHLTILRRAGLLVLDIRGRHHFYSINEGRIDLIKEFLKQAS